MTRRDVYIIFTIIMGLLFAAFVWPTLYRYDRLGYGGNSYPLRINRITGTGEFFAGHWRRTESAPRPDAERFLHEPSPAPAKEEAKPAPPPAR